MGKLLLLLFAVLTIGSVAQAQYGYLTYNQYPRYAPTPKNHTQANTYQSLSIIYDSIPPSSIAALGTGDTFYVTPYTYKTVVYSQIVDSIQLYVKTAPLAHTGDLLDCHFLNTNAATTAVYFAGPNWQVSDAIPKFVILANKEGIIQFEYNGATGVWVEISRNNSN